MSQRREELGYLYRGLFLITLGLLWVLWERRTITSLLQLAGYLLICFGIAVVLINLMPGDQVTST